MTTEERYLETVMLFRKATYLYGRMKAMKDAIKSYNRKLENEKSEIMEKSHRAMLLRSQNLYNQYEQELRDYLNEIKR